MRLNLIPTENFLDSIDSIKSTGGEPPLAFINSEPFIIELQGSLELPNSGNSYGDDIMDGIVVGKLILDEPHKPILQIAHHRLEGRIVTLTEPFALLRTTPVPSSSTNDLSEPSPKRPRLSQPPSSASKSTGVVATSSPEKMRAEEEEVKAPRIEIVGLVRRKLVFSKRPEPTSMSAMLSSEIDIPESGI